MNEHTEKIPFFSTLIRITLYAMVFLMASGGVTGCASKGPLLQKEVTLNILPEEKINNSKSLHLVIRTVSKKDFLIEEYDQIADLVYADPPDKSLIAYRVIVPGQESEIKVDTPVKTDVGIYGMFMEPGENWKVMLPDPVGEEYDIIVQDNTIKFIDKEKQSFWDRLKGIF